MADVRYADGELRVIIQDWDASDPDQAVAINMAREILRLRAALASSELATHPLAPTAVAAHETPSGETLASELWCLHIQGPDDLHPAPSREAAESAAIRTNEYFATRFANRDELAPWMKAVAMVWPYSAESHAESLGEWSENWELPQAPMEADRG